MNEYLNKFIDIICISCHVDAPVNTCHTRLSDLHWWPAKNNKTMQVHVLIATADDFYFMRRVLLNALPSHNITVCYTIPKTFRESPLSLTPTSTSPLSSQSTAFTLFPYSSVLPPNNTVSKMSLIDMASIYLFMCAK